MRLPEAGVFPPAAPAWHSLSRRGALLLLFLFLASLAVGSAHRHGLGADLQHCVVCHVAADPATPAGAVDVAPPPLDAWSPEEGGVPLPFERRTQPGPPARAPPLHA